MINLLLSKRVATMLLIMSVVLLAIAEYNIGLAVFFAVCYIFLIAMVVKTAMVTSETKSKFKSIEHLKPINYEISSSSSRKWLSKLRPAARHRV